MNIGVNRVLNQIDVSQLWRAVQRRLAIIVGLMVASGVFIYLSMSLFTPKYSAVAKIYITADEKAGEKPEALDLKSHTGAIYADNFLNNIIQTLNLHTHPEFKTIMQSGDSLLEELKSRLQISWESKSETLTLKFYSSDPNLSAEATNAIANAFLVMSKEKANGVRTHLALRAVAPLTPDAPKRGPIALLFMALAGLALFGYVITKEVIVQLERHQEHELDEKHHELDMEANIQLTGSSSLFHGTKSGPAYQGNYAWLPEESISHIVDQLSGMQRGNDLFRIVITGEAEKIAIGQDALRVARGLAAQNKSVLLIDAGDGDLSQIINIAKSPGMAELIGDPELLEEIIHKDPKSPLQIVGRGIGHSIALNDETTKNLRAIYSAWCAVYEVIIVCCSHHHASELDQILGDVFDAGVFVQRDGIEAEKPASKGFVHKQSPFDMLFYRQSVQNIGRKEQTVAELGQAR